MKLGMEKTPEHFWAGSDIIPTTIVFLMFIMAAIDLHYVPGTLLGTIQSVLNNTCFRNKSEKVLVHMGFFPTCSHFAVLPEVRFPRNAARKISACT